MSFSILDIILMVILAVAGWKGYKQGLIDALASLFALMIGLYGAYRLYQFCAWWLSKWTGWGIGFTKILMFIILFIIINRLVIYIFFLVDRFLQLIFKLPFVRTLDHILGGILMALESVLILALIIYIFRETNISSVMNKAISSSFIASYIIKIASFVWPFVPRVISNLF